jgi:hypothetical protein
VHARCVQMRAIKVKTCASKVCVDADIKVKTCASKVCADAGDQGEDVCKRGVQMRSIKVFRGCLERV